MDPFLPVIAARDMNIEIDRSTPDGRLMSGRS